MKVPPQNTMKNPPERPTTPPVSPFKERRKIINYEIVDCAPIYASHVFKDKTIVAFCNDGTLWVLDDEEWIKVEDIPQD